MPIYELRNKEFPNKKVRVEKGEVLEGGKDLRIELCEGASLNGDFVNCSIHNKIFMDLKGPPFRINGRYKDCVFFCEFPQKSEIRGKFSTTRFIEDLVDCDFRVEDVVCKNYPRGEGGEILSESIHVMAQTSKIVRHCPLLERSLSKNVDPVVYSPLMIRINGRKIQFLIRSYEEEGYMTRKETKKMLPGIFRKFGLIPTTNHSIVGGVKKDEHKRLLANVVYAPTGRNWIKYLKEIQELHKNNSRKHIIEKNYVIDETMSIRPCRPFLPQYGMSKEMQYYLLKK